MDMLRVWAHWTDADVIVSNETRLNKSITSRVIRIDGYNVYGTDQPKRGGGTAIFLKSKFSVNVLLSESVSKQTDFLALNLAHHS